MSSFSVKLVYIFVILYLIEESHCFNLKESLPDFLYRSKRQASCTNRRQFRCNNGQCISVWNRCDGKLDCGDGSDETAAECSKTSCPENSFRCQYGACIDIKKKCNGQKDCIDNSDENNSDCKRQTAVTQSTTVLGGRCSSSRQFTCSNGECIIRYKLCDGKVDCSDGSDETPQSCSNLSCDRFRCNYGACVDSKARCNGVKDCVDNSDEDPVKCGYGPAVTTQPTWVPPPPPGEGDCILPKKPDHGRYDILNAQGQPGTSVPEYTNIKYSCAPPSQYKLTSDTSVFTCVRGQWSFPTNSDPACLATCPPRVANTIDITCELNGHSVECSKRMLEGTKIHMACKPYHQHTADIYASNEATCQGGTWDQPYLRCTPECGKLDKIGQAQCINCNTATIDTHPWHVGIYKEEKGEIKHKCGGSIINPMVILSAAHCFTDVQDGAKQPINLFHIAAQKNFRDFNDPQDTDAQKRKAHKIIIPNDYRGYTLSFAADVALVVLDKPFQINNFVTSVCLDLIDVDYKPDPDTTGKVAGWGYTEEGGGLLDNRLKELTVPVIEKDDCRKKIPKTFESFVTSDKICAGYHNGSSVCQGDSGGGLVVLDRRRDLYYVRGVVSTSPLKGQWCNNFEVTAYTNVASHRKFLQQARDYYKLYS